MFRWSRLPDERLGETVAAWIKLKAGESAVEDEIREYCKGKIAHFKIPHYVRFVDAFPMTVTGKIQKVCDPPNGNRGASS